MITLLGLNERQTDIVRRSLSGDSVFEISQEMDISERDAQVDQIIAFTRLQRYWRMSHEDVLLALKAMIFTFIILIGEVEMMTDNAYINTHDHERVVRVRKGKTKARGKKEGLC